MAFNLWALEPPGTRILPGSGFTRYSDSSSDSEHDGYTSPEESSEEERPSFKLSALIGDDNKGYTVGEVILENTLHWLEHGYFPRISHEIGIRDDRNRIKTYISENGHGVKAELFVSLRNSQFVCRVLIQYDEERDRVKYQSLDKDIKIENNYNKDDFIEVGLQHAPHAYLLKIHPPIHRYDSDSLSD